MKNLTNKYALLIGVGDDLPYTVIDAKKIAETLMNESLVGYPKKNVILRTETNADRAGILSGFDELIAQTEKDSSVLIYYSGHGGTYELKDKSGNVTDRKFYLQPHGMTAENYLDHWVTAEELTQKVNAIKSNKLVFLLDCCHAEGMTQKGLVHMDAMAQQLNNDGGMWVISSCQDNQKSWRLPNAENSLFTECLLEVLTGRHKRPFTDPQVTITDVVEHIFEEVPKRARKVNNIDTGKPIDQTPFAKFQMSENVILSNFPKNIEGHEATIAELEPHIEKLGERSLIKLLRAMELVGRVDDALDILEKHKKTAEDADLLNVLGDLYKTKYLETEFEEYGLTSLKHHKKALQIAEKENDLEQVYLNAINLAFLFLLLDLDKREMQAFAKKALVAAEAYDYPSVEKMGTMAEAHIYLNQLEAAKKCYETVGKKGGIRTKMKIYKDAHTAYTILFNDNPNDEFIQFMGNKLLV